MFWGVPVISTEASTSSEQAPIESTERSMVVVPGLTVKDVSLEGVTSSLLQVALLLIELSTSGVVEFGKSRRLLFNFKLSFLLFFEFCRNKPLLVIDDFFWILWWLGAVWGNDFWLVLRAREVGRRTGVGVVGILVTPSKSTVEQSSGRSLYIRISN